MEQKYPGSFYHTKARSKAQYREEPPGEECSDEQDPTRPLYRIPGLVEAKKESHLILTESMLQKVGQKNRDKAEENLLLFLEDDFVLYGWKAGSLVPLETQQEIKTFIQQHDFSKQYVDVSEDEIINYAKQQKIRLVKNEVHILTQEELIGNHFAEKIVYDIIQNSHENIPYFHEDYELQYMVFDESAYSLDRLVFNVPLRLILHFYPLHELRSLKTVAVRDIMGAIYGEITPEVKEQVLKKINAQEWPHIKKLEYLSTSHSSDELEIFFAFIKKLATSLIKLLINFSTQHLLNFPKMPHLKSLILTQCKISTKLFQNIATHLNALEEIELTKCTIENDQEEVSLSSFQNSCAIKTLKLTEMEITLETLKIIMICMDSLESLTLAKCYIGEKESSTMINFQYSGDTLKNLKRNLEKVIAQSKLHHRSLLIIYDILENKPVDNSFETKLIQAPPENSTSFLSSGVFSSKYIETSSSTSNSLMGFEKKSSLSTQNKEKSVSNINFNFRPFDPTEFLNWKKTPDDFQFKFKGMNKTKNKGMVMEKLSQHLTLRQKSLEFLPKINDGLCELLTRLFHFLGVNDYKKLIDRLSQWDGSLALLDVECEKNLELVYTFFYRTYIAKDWPTENCQFIGTDSETFYRFIESGSTLELSLRNPWHSIGIRYLPEKQCYAVCDSCFDEGAKEVSKETLFDVVKISLHSLICTNQIIGESHEIPKHTFTNFEQFIHDGGILALNRMSSDQCKTLLERIHPHYEFNKACPVPLIEIKSLTQGLMLRTVEGVPAWVIGLQDNRLCEITAALLLDFSMGKKDSFARELIQSLNDVSLAEREIYLRKLYEVALNFPQYIDKYFVEDIKELIKQDYKTRILNEGIFQFAKKMGNGFINILKDIEPIDVHSNIEIDYTFLRKNLLARDQQGIPAWMKGIQNSQFGVRSYTLSALVAIHLFEKYRDNDFVKELWNSLQGLSHQDRKICLCFLKKKLKELDSVLISLEKNILNELVTRGNILTRSQEKFECKKKKIAQTVTLEAFAEQLISSKKQKNPLVEFSCSEDISIFQQYVHQQTKRLIFYINSLQDVVFRSEYVKHTGNHQGDVFEGPGGDLYDFLMKHQNPQNPPILIVNYDRFTPDDIERSQGLFAKNRHAAGFPLMEETTVLGFINPHKKGAYKGTDFYNAHEVCHCPFQESELKSSLQFPLEIREKTEKDLKVFPINFYCSEGWESIVWGGWIRTPKGLFFKEGILSQAIASGLPIEIQNGRWDDPKFLDFWRQAYSQGYIEKQGKRIDFPTKPTLLKSEGYDWDLLCTKLKIEESEAKGNVEILNPLQLRQFFKRSHINPDSKQPEALPGIIEEKIKIGEELHVNLTRALNEHEWAELLNACIQRNITLHCHPSKGVELPSHINKVVKNTAKTTNEYTPWKEEYNPSVAVIQTNDIDASVQRLKSTHKTFSTLSITHRTASELLYWVQREKDAHSGRTISTQRDSAIIIALKEKKPLLLHGKFSPELADALTTFLLDRQQHPEKYPGFSDIPVWLVTNKIELFQALPRYEQVISGENKQKCLVELGFNEEHINQSLLEKEPLVYLRARANYRSVTNDKHDHRAWEGMYHLPGKIEIAAFDPDTAEAEALNYGKEFRKSIFSRFKHDRFVCLIGHTGVGKTTNMETYLPSEDTVVYKGQFKTALKAWAKDKSKRKKIFFPDEINFESPEFCALLEGLYDNPPHVLLDGLPEYLDEGHGVVGAMNPDDYGDAREMHEFLKRHGNALVVPPISTARIYVEVLKPVLKNTVLDSIRVNISTYWLEMYRFILGCSTQSILISPREIKMIALLTLSFCEDNPQADCMTVAKHFAYQLGKTLVPKSHQKEFDSEYKPETNTVFTSATTSTTQTNTSTSTSSNSLVENSEDEVKQQLDHLLQLREHRQKWVNNDQKYGGLGGLFIEHDAVIDVEKEIVMPALKQRGYLLPDGTIDPSKPVYKITSDLSEDKKEKMLDEALDVGGIILIPNFDKLPIHEKKFNPLLMGKNSVDGRLAIKPGCVVIAWQSSEVKSGSYTQSNAIMRRFMYSTLQVSSLQKEQVLKKRGASDLLAKTLVNIYEVDLKESKEKNQTPLSWSDIEEMADEFIIEDRDTFSFKASLTIGFNSSQMTINQNQDEDIVEDFQEKLDKNCTVM